MASAAERAGGFQATNKFVQNMLQLLLAKKNSEREAQKNDQLFQLQQRAQELQAQNNAQNFELQNRRFGLEEDRFDLQRQLAESQLGKQDLTNLRTALLGLGERGRQGPPKPKEKAPRPDLAQVSGPDKGSGFANLSSLKTFKVKLDEGVKSLVEQRKSVEEAIQTIGGRENKEILLQQQVPADQIEAVVDQQRQALLADRKILADEIDFRRQEGFAADEQIKIQQKRFEKEVDESTQFGLGG